MEVFGGGVRGSFHLDVVSKLAALDDEVHVALLLLLVGRGASLRIPAPLSSV